MGRTAAPEPPAGLHPTLGKALPAQADVYEGISRKLLGAFYTPESVADHIADWAVRHSGEHVLEPSFGDGIFLRAVARSARRRDLTGVRISGVEVDENTLMRVLNDEELRNVSVRCEDFLSVRPYKVQSVVGNPPYVRLRRVSEVQREKALSAAATGLDSNMDPSGSLWMPFVLHAMRFLDDGGRLAFVLPYDLTYVRYARPLWGALRSNFGGLHVLRSHERLFPELLQDVVVLLADDYGGNCDTIQFQAFETVSELLNGCPVVNETLPVDSVLRGERVFVSALLKTELRDLLHNRVAELTKPARELVTFNIGYVAGDKSFFHPDESVVKRYELPVESLRPSLTSGRVLAAAGLRTSSLDSTSATRLYYPNIDQLTAGDQLYISHGKERGVSSRYKCRIRNPWFLVPGLRVPDLVLSVFSERPILSLNDGSYLASNSLLCGYRREVDSEQLAMGWYSSLTLLQCELEVHALGGGVMVMVPGEAGRIRLPCNLSVDQAHLSAVDHFLRTGRTRDAYRAGDQRVLVEQLGLGADELNLIHDGIEVLTHWRTSVRSSRA